MNTPNPNLPPPALLNAVRQSRRVQLHDPCVKALLAQWKKDGRPIDYADLNQVAGLIRVEHPAAATRRRIVEAVEADGIEIHNYDAERRWLAQRGASIGSLSGDGWMRRIEEQRWRWPEKWDRDDKQQRTTCHRVRRGDLEYILEHARVKPGDEILPWPDCEERWL